MSTIQWYRSQQIIGNNSQIITERTPGWIYILNHASIPSSISCDLQIELDDGYLGESIPLINTNGHFCAEVSQIVSGKYIKQITATRSDLQPVGFIYCYIDSESKSLLSGNFINTYGLVLELVSNIGGTGLLLQNMDRLTVNGEVVGQFGVHYTFPVSNGTINTNSKLWDRTPYQLEFYFYPNGPVTNKLIFSNGASAGLYSDTNYAVHLNHNGGTYRFGGLNGTYPPGVTVRIGGNNSGTINWEEDATINLSAYAQLYATVGIDDEYMAIIARRPDMMG